MPGLPGFKLESSVPTESIENVLVGELMFNHSWDISIVEPWIINEEVAAIREF